MRPQRTKAGSRIPAVAYRTIVDLAVRPNPPTAAQVYQELRARGLAKNVSARTVQRVLNEIGPDKSDRWSMDNADPEDIRAVLWVVRALLDEPTGPFFPRIPLPSQRTGEWIAKIRRAYSDIHDPIHVYYLAALAARGAPWVDRVATFLAFAPWTDSGPIPLFEAVRRGAVESEALIGNDMTLDYLKWKSNKELQEREEPKK
jgi:hypothetical protein